MKPFLFFLIVILVAVLLVLAFFFPNIYKAIEKKRFPKAVYHVLSDYAEENDQLLLNDVEVYLGGSRTPTHFDHILCADKYMYLIQDFLAEGGVYGNGEDSFLFLQHKKGESSDKITNPIQEQRRRTAMLTREVKLPPEQKYFFSVVVFNNSLIVPSSLQEKKQGEWFLPLKELKKTIVLAEQDDVTPIRHEDTESLVRQLKAMSDRYKDRLDWATKVAEGKNPKK